MVTLVFDGKTGASGDMIIGALISIGAERNLLNPVEDGIDVKYNVERCIDQGIAAEKVNITRNGKTIEGEHSTKNLEEITEIINSLDLPNSVISDSNEIFRILANAEAKVHGTNFEEIHLHEVGSDDAISDIVGASILINSMHLDSIYTTPISVGGGVIKIHHGEYPVPVPAVMAIVEKTTWSIKGGPVEMELLTPTGAAILAHFATGIDVIPNLNVKSSGYGAGNHKIPGIPNVLRTILGVNQLTIKDEIVVLETNVDDVSPEVLGNLYTSLLSDGARDVVIIPAMMKKARPGHVIKVIVKPELKQKIAQKLARETGTLGIREVAGTHRWIANRKIKQITIKINEQEYCADIKIASENTGDVYNVSAEYEDAKRIALETNQPLKQIIALIEEQARKKWMI